MAGPRVQYAKTKDGVSIAFTTLGEGRPLLVLTSIPYSHCQRIWDVPEFRRYYEAMGRNRRLVLFDYRGTGLSQRGITEYSMDALLLDMEAVVERLELERLRLYAEIHAGALAIAYAASHPEQVSHLILWCSWARAVDFFGSPPVRAFGRALERDWESYTETASHGMSGWAHGDIAHRWAAYMRDCVNEETARAVYRAVRRFDVTNFLPRVSAPTLVLHPRGFPFMDMEIPTRLASEMPNARLSLVDGDAASPSICDAKAIVVEIDEFLGESDGRSGQRADASASTAVILFADIADSTGLTERLGDAAFRGRARELDGSLRSIIRGAGGTPIEGKLLGDGVLAVFTSARQAIEAALSCGEAGSHGGLPLHLGAHAGDVIREEGNVYGGAVNIAARIAGASAPGEVLVSQTVRDLARTSAGVAFEDCGERELKGVSEPVRVWAVRGQAPA